MRALAVSLLLIGCVDGDWCHEGQRHDDWVCLEAVEGDTGLVDAMALPDAASGDGAAAPDISAASAATLAPGTPCSGNPECGPAPAGCVVLPGDTIGYCSVVDCAVGGDDCPAGYACTDVSAFTDEIDTVCLR